MKKIIAVLLATVGLVSLAGCSSAGSGSTVTSSATIIDVRTPQEYAEGHLDGAVLMDVSSPDFAAQLDTLDRNGEYGVYCRSGNRSATAVAQMTAAGFVNVTDLGSRENASRVTGKDIVQ